MLRKRLIWIAVSVFAVAGIAAAFSRWIIVDESVSSDFAISQPNTLPLTATTTSAAQGILEVAHSASIDCDEETYSFDSYSVLLGAGIETFVTDIHRAQGSGTKEFIVRLTPPQQESIYAGKRYATRWIYIPLSTPETNCNSIYLTTRLFIAHPVPVERIFEWPIGARNVKELSISREFSGELVPYMAGSGNVPPVSPDGEKVLIARRESSASGGDYCGFKALRLLDLRSDTAETVLNLSSLELLDNGSTDLEPYCNGLNFGWQDRNTIWYDVYNATVDHDRPLIERRTLKVPSVSME